MKILNRYYYSFLQKRLERRYSEQNSRGAILMLHEVYRDQDMPRKPSTAVSESNFLKLIEYIGVDNLQKSVHSYDDLFHLNENEYVLTFDDVHRSALLNAVPHLRERAIPYILFVSVELIDREFYITSDDLEELKHDSLCTIGSHAIHHRKFRYYEKDFPNELKESAAGLNAAMFAYPYGSLYAVSNRNIEDIKNSGIYSCAFSTISASLTDENLKNRWMIPRISVSDDVFA